MNGPFGDLLEAYLKQHGRFFDTLEKIEGNNFQEKVVNYLACNGVKNPIGSNISELMGILLLRYLANDKPSLALALLRDWGAPFAFILGGGDRESVDGSSLSEQGTGFVDRAKDGE